MRERLAERAVSEDVDAVDAAAALELDPSADAATPRARSDPKSW